MLKFIFVSLLLSLSCFAQDISDDLMNVSIEVNSKTDSSVDATREIIQTAMSDTARAQVIDIIGEKKYQKNKALIERKIVAEAAKFIPISDSKNLVQNPDKTYKAQVDMKLSLSSLRKMIQSTGLLIDSDELAVVLPLIVYRDDKNSYAWWENTHDDSKRNLADISQLFDSAFTDDMFHSSFYVIKPTPVVSLLVPDVFRSVNLKRDDFKTLSNFYHANLIAKGEVVFKSMSSTNMQLTLRIDVVQSSNDREIAEVTRTINIDRANMPMALKTKLQSTFSEIAKDLSAQVLDTWQKGTFGSNSILVSVKGLASPKQVQDFKNELRKNIHDIKALKERVFESGQVTFEMDYTTNDASIVDHLKTAKLDSFDYHFVDSNDKMIRTEVRAKTR